MLRASTFSLWLHTIVCGMILLPRKVIVFLLMGYKYLFSPLFPPACRFEPTCSKYAIEAITKYGAFRGGAMALWRLMRCHPFSRGGYDPVQ